MPPVSRTERAAEAWEALFRAQVAVMRRLAADDVWDELSMREYDVLFTLSRAPGRRLRLHDLNREILLSQPSLSRLVERLVVAGLVARECDPGDRRGTVVALTDRGARQQQSVGRRHAASIRRHVGPALSDDELDTLTELCAKLRGAQD
ncbi:MarR family winged helix-turn-helix transcriptional regulator [Rhodococcus sp. NPDC056960]|uniref:MarR family winged helix-turn-helix transcriptional regulator n=1 Tax=Rhodococcus sp. NPDC056960 TaxID=3345982 RepID=UPI003631131A